MAILVVPIESRSEHASCVSGEVCPSVAIDVSPNLSVPACEKGCAPGLGEWRREKRRAIGCTEAREIDQKFVNWLGCRSAKNQAHAARHCRASIQRGRVSFDHLYLTEVNGRNLKEIGRASCRERV